jgi:hypothetical protein
MTEMPSPPVVQPIVYKDDAHAQTSSDLVFGALDEYYFVSYRTAPASLAYVTLWQITSKSNGVLRVAEREYSNVSDLVGAANDKGDAVVVYRGVSGNWQMDTITHQKKSLVTQTVILQGSSTISNPQLYMTMDGMEVVLINALDQRAWGFTRDGLWAWDIKPPYEEYPYSGDWLLFPRAGRGVFKNTTPLAWSTYHSMTQSGAFVTDEPAKWSWHYIWHYPDYVEHYPNLTPQDYYIPNPTYSPSPAYEDECWDQIRATGEATFTFDVPDIVNGYLTGIGSTPGQVVHYSTVITVSRVRLLMSFLWSGGKTLYRQGGYVPGDATYEYRKALNGPNPTDIQINGVSKGTTGISTYVDATTGSLFEFRCGYTEDITLPAPGTFSVTAKMFAGWPTTAQKTTYGMSSAGFPGGSTLKYNYVPGAGYSNPGHFIRLEVPDFTDDPSGGAYGSTGNPNTHDRFDSGGMYFVEARASLLIDYDSSDRQGGYIELRDNTGVWGPPRLGTHHLDRIAIADVDLRGNGEFPVEQKLAYHRLVDSDGGTPPGAFTYYLSLLDTAGDALTMGAEQSFDVNEPWWIAAKTIGPGGISSWKGQLSIVPSIQDQGPATQ